MYLREGQRQVFVTFGIVVRVYFPQVLIQNGHKLRFINRCLLKFYYPFMCSLVTFFVKINRSSRKISNRSTRSVTCHGYSAFGVIYNDFFSKCVDKMFCSSRDPDPEW